ncbi:MAG: forkhead-associated protein [Rhodocyclaceae bacterium]|nr:MAG: forkhead-associated protein [Rhodocyclaceae bacterium]TND03113.1 MAG: forkhead-associated protein [Rhodocyclaceae bacterium]
MIRCLLVQIARNRHGHPIRSERRIAGDTLRIGRGAECALHLPDHRVKLRHAVIRGAEDGKFYIAGEGTSIEVDGGFHQVAELRPGTRVPIGPYRLIVEASSDDGELVISVELVHPRPPDEAILARAPASLAAAGLSKRRPAVWLAALIGLFFLLLPILQATSPALREALASMPLTPRQTWNPGPLMAGHQTFAGQCDTCHRRPFEPVPDHACESCHRGTAAHSSASAAVVRRCAECHRDHKGASGLVRGDRPLCISCHEAVRERDATSVLANVDGFDSDHPPFRLTLKSGAGQDRPRRNSQSAKTAPTENSGLRFSHRAHQGKLRLPSDPRLFRTMDCGDCHQVDSGDLRFRPVTMKGHCFECHKEAFDFNPPLDGHRLPHGSERAVMDALENFHLKKILAEAALRGGRAAAGGIPLQQALDTAAARARKAVAALAGEMGCGLCHETKAADETSAVPWTIQRVTVTEHWLPAARFSHEKHRVGKCADCHAVSHSDRSADIAIPDIEMCRQCHSGERPAGGKIASPCASCHRFHQPVAALPDPVLSHRRG